MTTWSRWSNVSDQLRGPKWLQRQSRWRCRWKRARALPERTKRRLLPRQKWPRALHQWKRCRSSARQLPSWEFRSCSIWMIIIGRYYFISTWWFQRGPPPSHPRGPRGPFGVRLFWGLRPPPLDKRLCPKCAANIISNAPKLGSTATLGGRNAQWNSTNTTWNLGYLGLYNSMGMWYNAIAPCKKHEQLTRSSGHQHRKTAPSTIGSP